MAPGPIDRERVARRLEAGDWVVATGEAARVSHGLGKLSDGDYDPADDALLRARVDFAVGPRWIAAADLERVTPDDELALVERALDRGLIPAPRAERLRDALQVLRAGERVFVRSPGLLDVVWGALDEPLAAPGLVEWFEDGAEELRAARAPEPAAPAAPAAPASEGRAPHPPVTPNPQAPPPLPDLEPANQGLPPPEPALPRDEVLRRVLGTLSRRTLRHLLRALWGRAAQGDAPRLRAVIEAARPSLSQILRHLDERQLRGGLQACGRDSGLGLNVDQLRAALLILAHEPPPEPRIPTHRADASRLAPEAVLPLVLEHLNRTVLLALARACEVPIEAVDARRLRAAIVAARPPLVRVLGSLTTNQLRRAHADCGLMHAGSLDDSTLRAELVGLLGPGAVDDTSRGLNDAERVLLGTVLGAMSLAGLFRIARGMGLDWARQGRGPPAQSILDGAHAPESILARLQPDELSAACRACGIEPPHEVGARLAALRALTRRAPQRPAHG